MIKLCYTSNVKVSHTYIWRGFGRGFVLVQLYPYLGEDILEVAGEENLLAALYEVRVEGYGMARLVVHCEHGQLVLRRVLIIRS